MANATYSKNRTFAAGNEVRFQYSIGIGQSRVYTLRARVDTLYKEVIPNFVEWENITPKHYGVSNSDWTANTYTLLPNDSITNRQTGISVKNNLKAAATVGELQAYQGNGVQKAHFPQSTVISFEKPGTYYMDIPIVGNRTGIGVRDFLQPFGTKTCSVALRELANSSKVYLKYTALEDIVDGFGNPSTTDFKVGFGTLTNPAITGGWDEALSQGEFFYIKIESDSSGNIKVKRAPKNAPI